MALMESIVAARISMEVTAEDRWLLLLLSLAPASAALITALPSNPQDGRRSISLPEPTSVRRLRRSNQRAHS